MKKYFSTLALMMVTVSGSAYAKSLELLSQPEPKSTVVATVQSGDKLIPIFMPEKSDWIKVADPKNGQVGWLKREDLGMNAAPKIYEKRIEKESGDKKKGPYTREIFEYKGTEKLSDEQVKSMFEKMERQQARMEKAMWSMFDNMMTQFSNFEHMIPDIGHYFDHPHFIVVPDDVKKEVEKNSSLRVKNNFLKANY